MASSVAQPLERQFAIIPGIAQMTSVSVAGSSQITIQFDLDRNIDGAAGDVLAQINAATGQLPKNLPSPPTYWKVNPSDAPIMILALQSDSVPLIDVNDYADTVLAQQISQLSGVGQVFIGGERKRSIRVQADPAKLAAMGMTLEDVRQVLVNATANAPKGTIDGAERSYSILDNDQTHQGVGIRGGHRRLAGRRADPGEGYRHCRRRGGKPLRRRLPERRPRGHAADLQAARRQRH